MAKLGGSGRLQAKGGVLTSIEIMTMNNSTINSIPAQLAAS